MKKTNRNLFDKIRESFGNLVKRIAEFYNTECVSNSRDSPTPYKTVHWTVLYLRFAQAGLSSPI